jgi:hypothetical protein
VIVRLPEQALDTTGADSLPPPALNIEYDASCSHLDGLVLAAKNPRAAAKAPWP